MSEDASEQRLAARSAGSGAPSRLAQEEMKPTSLTEIAVPTGQGRAGPAEQQVAMWSCSSFTAAGLQFVPPVTLQRDLKGRDSPQGAGPGRGGS